MKQSALREILELPVGDRIRLVQRVLDSIADEQRDVELSDEQKAEIERRVRAHARNPRSAIPLEKVLAEMGRRKK